ncbi:MAG: bifunctional transcriptional activator/DNA repair protein Ada [Fimbriimonadaceae bacterium]|nr:bifunctional transcriptional activator/DNA repair protein Ada [Fimbriimonadaceae bacterium]
MTTAAQSNEWTRAYLENDAAYDGLFFVAVKTTKIFCRPVCPARKPFPKNVEFFEYAKDALTAGYRPCKRCRPMDMGVKPPEWVRPVISMVEAEPQTRWQARHLVEQGVDPARVRRYFKRQYGMTFAAYCRARRLGTAMDALRRGQMALEAGMDSGFSSSSGFRAAFDRVFGVSPNRVGHLCTVTMRWFDSPLGPLVGCATDTHLVLLEFADRRMLETQMKTLQNRLGCVVVQGPSGLLDEVGRQLDEYFAGQRTRFDVPLATPGTPFQEEVWRYLCTIPFGETRSYGQMAKELGRPDAQRAVGKANGDNRVAIIVPCHRVVRSDGTLCGYGGGLWRKKRLLELESGQCTLAGVED